MRRPSRWIFAVLALSLTTAAGLATRAAFKSHAARAAAADKARAEEIMASYLASPPAPSPASPPSTATSPQATPLPVAPPKTPEGTARPAPAAKPQGKPLNSVAPSRNTAQLTDAPASAKTGVSLTAAPGEALPSNAATSAKLSKQSEYIKPGHTEGKPSEAVATFQTAELELAMKAEELRDHLEVVSLQSLSRNYTTTLRLVQPDVVISGGARLVIHFSKRSDINGDGTIDNDDYLAFTEAFSGGDSSADFNHDGSIDFFDFRDFTAAFDAGR